jgi:hypothetical protein
MVALLAGWLTILPMGAAQALQVGDVTKDPVARVAGSKLVLNGAGLRHRFKVDIYVIGLYLPQLQSSAQAAIGAEGPKRVALTLLRNLDAKWLVDGLYEGLRDSTTEEEFARIRRSADALAAVMLPLEGARKGDVLALDYVPGSGAQVVVNGRTIGAPIPDRDFYQALLKIWLGDNPVDGELKRQLLGRRAGTH